MFRIIIVFYISLLLACSTNKPKNDPLEPPARAVDKPIFEVTYNLGKDLESLQDEVFPILDQLEYPSNNEQKILQALTKIDVYEKKCSFLKKTH